MAKTPGLARRITVGLICGLGNLFIRPLWRWRARKDLREAGVRRILVVRSRYLGDVLQSTPLLRELKKYFPQAQLTYIVADELKEILEGNPYLDETIGGNIWFDNSEGWQGRVRFIKSLRKQKFDVVITLGTFAHYYLLSFLSGARHRVGFDLNERGFLLTRSVRFSWESPRNRVDWFLEPIQLMGIGPPEDKSLIIAIPKEAQRYADTLLGKSGIRAGDTPVILFPGGARHGEGELYPRRWAPEKFARLGDKLVKKYGVRVVLGGSSEETKLCEQVHNLMEEKSVNLAGKTTVKQLAALLKRMRLLIGNDSAPVQVAAAVGISTVAIFGPQDPRRVKPYGAHHHAVYKDLECRPCYNPDRKPTCNEARCLELIEVEDVLKVIGIELGGGR